MFDTAHLHPVVVHFPIALIIVGFIADVLSLFFKSEKCLSRTGFYLMVIGSLAALTAWATGHLFTDDPAGDEVLKILEKHETGALITIIIMIIGASLRVYLVANKKEETNLKWIVFGLYFLGTVTVIFTGFMGGTMVYKFLLGI
jgi:uncharacterized membrane protein